MADPSDPLDASFHLVAYPPEARFATVSCATTNGTIRLTKSTEGDPSSLFFSPDSPVFNLHNPSCAGNVVIPLQVSSGKPEVVVVTFCNTSTEPGSICVVVALSFPPEDQQKRLIVKRNLASRQSTVLHIVLSLG